MRYNRIKEFDTTNGTGIRVSLWVQGCSKRCPHCFNKETWDFKLGKPFTEDTIDYIIALLKDNNFVKRDLSILGGEPLELVNIPLLTKLVKRVKTELPTVKIWLWSNKQAEEVKLLELSQYLDVLVDGEFVQELYNPKLNYRGSSNQRIIDIQQSLAKGEVVLHELNN